MQIRVGKEDMVIQTASACGWAETAGVYALAAACNAVWAEACGAEGMSVQARIAYPHLADKTPVYRMKQKLARTCKIRGICLEELAQKEQPLLRVPEVTVTAAAKGKLSEEKNDGADRDVVMIGRAGMEGMLRILDERGEELEKRFSSAFLSQASAYRRYLFAQDFPVKAECTPQERRMSEICAGRVKPIRDGGVFAALYELSQEEKVGLDLDLKRIPILQETIEICEHFRINPYQLASAGSFLALTGDGEALAEELLAAGVCAAVIGRTQTGAKKILHNGEDIRYLDRPAPDEIARIFLL